MEKKDRVDIAIDNVSAMGEIATGIKMTQEDREIFRMLAEGKISKKEADQMLIDLTLKGK